MLCAQTTDLGPAILEEAPLQQRLGIDVLPPNVIPHWYARYSVADSTLDLYYVEGQITYVDRQIAAGLFGAVASCSVQVLYAAGPGLYYYHYAPDDWSILVDVGGRDDIVCRFVGRFIEQFLIFSGLTDSRVQTGAGGTDRNGPLQVMTSEFPAVIDLN
jgi:hypothetical protein